MSAYEQLPAIVPLKSIVGDDFTIPLSFTSNPSEDPIDLTGYTFEAQVRTAVEPSKEVAEFTVVETDLVNGQVTLVLTDAQTLAIGAGKNLTWFFAWETSGNRRTILSGKFTLNLPSSVNE